MSRLLIFANPVSGRGRGIKILDRLLPTLSAAGYQVESHTDHPESLAPIDDVDSVYAMIVIGGDGTLRAVVERLKHLHPDAPLPPVLVIGLGTANLMQRHLGLRYRKSDLPQQVARLLQNRKTKQVDVATAGEHLFLLMASCGLDSSVVEQLARARTGPISKATYLPFIARSLTQYAFSPVTVTVDGQVVHRDAPAQVFVGNVAEYGTGFPVLDRASSFDQRLDVCVLPARSRVGLMRLMLLTMLGKHHGAPGVVYTTGRDVRIESAIPMPIQIDGESAGMTPTHIRLLDTPVGFIVP